jgi:hypothetical protein
MADHQGRRIRTRTAMVASRRPARRSTNPSKTILRFGPHCWRTVDRTDHQRSNYRQPRGCALATSAPG